MEKAILLLVHLAFHYLFQKGFRCSKLGLFQKAEKQMKTSATRHIAVDQDDLLKNIYGFAS